MLLLALTIVLAPRQFEFSPWTELASFEVDDEDLPISKDNLEVADIITSETHLAAVEVITACKNITTNAN